jgi:hypothetical protein
MEEEVLGVEARGKARQAKEKEQLEQGGADFKEPQRLVNMFRRMEKGAAGNSLSQQI